MTPPPSKRTSEIFGRSQFRGEMFGFLICAEVCPLHDWGHFLLTGGSKIFRLCILGVFDMK